MTIPNMLGYFLKEKSELKIILVALLEDLKATEGEDCRYTHCDDDGENEAFERPCKQEEMGVKFKYTMPCTPQQNGQVKPL